MGLKQLPCGSVVGTKFTKALAQYMMHLKAHVTKCNKKVSG